MHGNDGVTGKPQDPFCYGYILTLGGWVGGREGGGFLSFDNNRPSD